MNAKPVKRARPLRAMRLLIACGGMTGLLSSTGVNAESAEDIAAKLANPNTPLATMNLKLQYRTYFDANVDIEDDDELTDISYAYTGVFLGLHLGF